MDDKDFLAAFEAATLEDFHHADHVRIAWLYLRREPLLQALDHFSRSLRHFAATKGAHDLYHETITWAFLLIIHERMERLGGEHDWPTFCDRNADLMTYKPSVLDRYYRAETLKSAFAKRVFVLPDRGQGAGTEE